MAYLYCGNTECNQYLGSLGGDTCNICGWSAPIEEINDEDPPSNSNDGKYLNWKSSCLCCK